ncbi:MAG: dihydrolipoyl dehydrogenase [Gammaproteobacteria bacterium]|jgi:dihydrolipoamide dehydrogenase
MSQTEIRIPDLGDFDEVDVVEVLVAPGDEVAAEQALITLETDKATMDVPAPAPGRIVEVHVATGAKVSAGVVIATLETTAAAATAQPAQTQSAADAKPAADAESADANDARDHRGKRLVVLGAGPGGYTAAFRAADLGLDVTLIERWPSLGGVCLNVGCIPSKALLHAARVIEEADAMRAHGIVFGDPEIDAGKLAGWKDSVIAQLTQGLAGLARQRNVTVVHGYGRFVSAREIEVEADGERVTIEFDQCIVAAGSEPARMPDLPDDPRIVDSTGALEIDPLPDRLLVVGGGIIGLEMATVYDALGVEVSIVELTPTLIPGCDRDLVRPLQKRLEARYSSIMLATGVTGMEALEEGIRVRFEGKQAPEEPQLYDRVLVAVGRRANGTAIDAEKAGIAVSERGLIEVDRQMRTNVPHIYAIGDIVGMPMLAHKATHEGRVAAEVAAGKKSWFDARVIPSVAYTDPEIAWVGVTEEQAGSQGIEIEKGVFPWAASGRSLSIGRSEGMTKIIIDKTSDRVIGVGIVGTNAGDLIAEAGLAIEMGCDAADIGLTIHPHPTLSETLAFAAEAAEGTITDLYLPKR